MKINPAKETERFHSSLSNWRNSTIHFFCNWTLFLIHQLFYHRATSLTMNSAVCWQITDALRASLFISSFIVLSFNRYFRHRETFGPHKEVIVPLGTWAWSLVVEHVPGISDALCPIPNSVHYSKQMESTKNIIRKKWKSPFINFKVMVQGYICDWRTNFNKIQWKKLPKKKKEYCFCHKL